MFQEPVGRNDHLILLEIPAEGIYFVHSRNAFQQRVDDPFLNRSQVRQILDFLLGIIGHLAVERELVYLPHGGRNGSHGDFDAFGDILPRFGQSLKDKLSGKVNIDTVFKDNGHQGKAELGDRAHLFDSSEARAWTFRWDRSPNARSPVRKVRWRG